MQQTGVLKKKPRHRNRPRNKCNQVQSDQTDSAGAEEKPSSVVTTQEAEAGPGPDSDPIKLIQQLLRRKLLAKSAVPASKEHEPTGAPPEPATANPSKQAKEDERKPRTPAVPTSSAPEPVVPKVAGTPAKQSKDVRGYEVNELLKCLGSRLQMGGGESPTAAMFSNLGKLFSQAPPSDVESSDDEAEYIEYIYKPRKYFMASLCNLCKSDLCGRSSLPCARCGLSYYCSPSHMREDQDHRQLCYALRQAVDLSGHEMFYKCGAFSAEQFRSYRIVCIRQVEKEMNRSLSPTEQEVLLFPLICGDQKCREHRFKRLQLCGGCGEFASCRDKPDHRSPEHAKWCGAYRLFKAFVMFQAKFGRLEPSLPNRVLRELPMACCNSRQMMNKLSFNVVDECEYAALTQVSTGPLTAWFALKLCERLRNSELTLHLIGAEIEFEVDVLQKWELFLLHIMPALKCLNVVFVGPELNPNNISFEQLKKIKCCRLCRKAQRTVNYHFENNLYHDYCREPQFLQPDLVCFYNSGLYRSTGYALEDTWPDTIQASLNLKCPIVVTSYTKYEAPLDMAQFVGQSNRHLNIVLPPTTNPFSSEKPERNFISDNEAPFMFKNFYCFVVE
ncbi:uncharacterized protein LOC108153765 [Drosophila miranda]|uniref:uncharacterized protein LOC108153765 n=1 Tax=Drosophila miranda TaxID=7229 RepID=UPI0007E72ED4|nr:uncharacterized protein LOC108153765 [Drosophila miranda]